MNAGKESLLGHMQDAPDEIGAQFKEAAQRRDAATLRLLFQSAYPNALWGKYFNELSEEDRAWVQANLTEAQSL